MRAVLAIGRRLTHGDRRRGRPARAAEPRRLPSAVPHAKQAKCRTPNSPIFTKKPPAGRPSGTTGLVTARERAFGATTAAGSFWRPIARPTPGSPLAASIGPAKGLSGGYGLLPRKPGLGAPFAGDKKAARQPHAATAGAGRKSAARAIRPEIDHRFVRRPRLNSRPGSKLPRRAPRALSMGAVARARRGRPDRRRQGRAAARRRLPRLDGRRACGLRGAMADRDARAAGLRPHALDGPASGRRRPRRAVARQGRHHHSEN